jgi:phosphoglycerate dehydrogenase-like enzyme
MHPSFIEEFLNIIGDYHSMKLLITDLCALDEAQRKILEGMGLEVLECADDQPYPDPSQIDILACKFLLNHTPIEQFTNLKYIQLFMAGFDHMPMDYIQAHGIEFHNARDVYSDPIAEFAIGGILALYKKFRDFDREQQEHVWNLRRVLPELTDKKVLIVGAGSIGTAFARRLQAFDCEVIGLARTGGMREHYDVVLPMETLDECLPLADIVILCLPNNGQTRHVMDKARFDKMKSGAIFVNIARGALVDEPALIGALTSGQLGGAVLDVFEVEPLPVESPLWDMENVIARPHTSFAGELNQKRLFHVMNRNLQASDLLK